VSGYFLKQSSVAVLSLPSFQEPGSAVGSFSSAVTAFLSAAKSAGMQKVVIDVQQNYGGDVFLAVDTFKQFFPVQTPFGGSRMRATSPTNAMGGAITGYWDSLDDTFDDYYNFYDDEWMALTRLNADTNQNFTSWNEFYGPHVFNGDSFTTTASFTFHVEHLASTNKVTSNAITLRIILSVRFQRKTIQTTTDLLYMEQKSDRLILLSRMLPKILLL